MIDTMELPPVTIITSIYNEGNDAIKSVLSSLNTNYKNLYIILVNDGSTDNTLELLVDSFEMIKEPFIFNQKIKTAEIFSIYVSMKNPGLMLIDKKHSSVGDSLNAAINVCFTPYFITVDADSIIDENAVSEFMFEMLSNNKTVSVGGSVYILNNSLEQNGKILSSRMPRTLIPALQSNEYLCSHLFNRTGWNSFGSSMSYSGTATIFSLKAVRAVGGFDVNNFAQDADMIMRLHHYMRRTKQAYQIRFNPAATVWTDVPKSLKEFTWQRDRWQRGLLKSVLNHKAMIFNPKYKIQGLFSFPIFILLEIIAPFVEFTAYITLPIAYFLGILNGRSVILYMLLAWGFTTFLTVANMFVSLITFNRYKKFKDIIRMFLLSTIEMLGFRQYLTGVKVFASFHYFINRIRGKSL
ncbi:glycosyltransferase family 2 protein [Legionella pneumophila]|nr:glycosyltransferase family 2 protein [Legionella pneumophila]WII10811.1 glycosyltransferase family 2 protein [Legionella pneumophila]WII13987.1 glycosyltransferase family 2 protein [Legionella pneumophila]WII17006.1 glycosyltransferase family 2 protein [Legionella pneumophila]